MADTPRVSIGMPVFNSRKTIEMAIDSVLAQTHADLELIVADNGSTDGTQQVVEDYAARDARVTYVRHPENIGQNRNFAAVAEMATGELFRWLGDDDWLEPSYLERLVEVFDADPTAVAVTSFQIYREADGTDHLERYDGPRVTGADPITRLDQMLDLLTGSPFWIDPVYTLVRRDVLMRTGLIRPMQFGDLAVACELALAGPWRHVPEVLCGRMYATPPSGPNAFKRYTGRSGPQAFLSARTQRVQFCALVARMVARHPDLAPADRRRGWAAVAGYYGRLRSKQVRRRIDRTLARAARA
jgi:glycosyltransferase involved in cell wall biosynthesis